MMFEAKLQMRLQSSEPKCSNCAHWFRPADAPGSSFGACRNVANYQRGELPVLLVITTDLTVCSKWESKDGQQAEEAR